jgi:hypothetical protein
MAGAHDHPSAASETARIPFWIHQLVELLLGLLLLVEGARTGEHTVVLVSLGALLLLLALCSDGALGAATWIGRRIHRVLDLVAAAVLAVSPLVLGLDRVLAIVLIEVAAGAMVWLALRTEWRPKPPRATKTRRPTPAAAPPSAPSTPAPPAPPLARKLGGAIGRARDDGPRQLGRLVGRAQRVAKAATTPEPPSPPASERPQAPPTPTPPPSAPAEPPEDPSPA